MSGSRDTIFALSSGRPPAAIAVVRISGPRAGAALEQLTGRLPAPRQAALARVRDPVSNEAIDQALALWFPGPKSETGEDMAELQLHGGRAIVAGVLDALAGIENCRPAEAGEFTRRAFENGKLDLTAVEGLADLVAAETPAQRRLAFRQLKGLIGDCAEDWRRRLIEALALIEARIDFADEADVPQDLIGPARAAVQKLRDDIAQALADGGRGERLREGLVVAIAGPPNAGKSTLLNRLAQREAAIVSPYPGTTRDVIEVHLDLDGYPVTLLDTAGIRESDDAVEQEGVHRARVRAATADLVLWVIDRSAAGRAGESSLRTGSGDADGATSMSTGSSNAAPAAEVWRIENKADLNPAHADPVPGEKKADIALPKANNTKGDARTGDESGFTFIVSAKEGRGVDALVDRLTGYAQSFFSIAESSLITRARHRNAFQETIAALDRALDEPPAGREELIAEDLRAAAAALGRLTGRVDVEDVLDVIFRDFCIGK